MKSTRNRSGVEDFSGPTLGPDDPAMAPTVYAQCKYVLDFALALLVLIPAVPFVLASMVLVRLTSRGPLIYSQTRLGRFGRPFTLYKLRTMSHDCERETGPRWSTPDDPRVTPVGRVLRSTHIDELPQLWNVLRGEMSLVGPRPERPEFVSQLERTLPNYRARLSVLPGLTGLAQVQQAPDTDLDSVRRKLEFDLYYAERSSPFLDLRILLSTATGVLGIPFNATRKLFGVPNEDAVAEARRVLEVAPKADTTQDEAAPQMQPA